MITKSPLTVGRKIITVAIPERDIQKTNGEIKMKDGKYFRPTVNEIYTNKNGSQYRCLSADGFDAEMIHTTSKWRFKALGCHMYDDGKIEWNWSIGGYFDTAQGRASRKNKANDD